MSLHKEKVILVAKKPMDYFFRQWKGVSPPLLSRAIRGPIKHVGSNIQFLGQSERN